MKELFLTSAGLVDEVKEDFLKLLSKKPQDTLLTFIPTAADPYDDKSWVEKDKELIRNIGMQINEVDLKGESEKTLFEKLNKYDVIYVGGGNTFYLLYWIRKSGFDKIIADLLDKGEMYVGVSAGSMIVGPNIESAAWEGVGEEPDKNEVGLKDLRGINFVPFIISPHFVENDREALEKGSAEVRYPIIALTDKQAVLVEGDKWQIIGEGERINI